MKKSVLKFNSKELRKVLFDNLAKEQTERLVRYAKEQIEILGETISAYHSKHNLDRTGHLLNSLCWVVTYDTGKENKFSGFYRPAQLHSNGKYGTSESWLHEFFTDDDEPIEGRQLAEEFVNSVNGVSGKWTVSFAILAPYWGYWESGFTLKGGGGDVGTPNRQGSRVMPKFKRHIQFQVMSRLYDKVRMDLRPAETRLTVFVPKYYYKNRKYKNRGVKHIGVMR